MTLTDTCPRCCRRGITPARTRTRGDQTIDGYHCPCGHQWATTRDLTAYSDIHARRNQRHDRKAA